MTNAVIGINSSASYTKERLISAADNSAMFEASLNRLVGQVCWGFAAGEGTGSVINFYIGGKVPRESPLSNLHLAAEQREYEAEINLFVECAWRIESKTEVICGAWDDNTEGGDMIAGLRRLVDQSVSSVKVSQPALDLTLDFSNGLTLRVFCDQTNQAEGEDNYTLFLNGAIYVVGSRSQLRRETARTPG